MAKKTKPNRKLLKKIKKPTAKKWLFLTTAIFLFLPIFTGSTLAFEETFAKRIYFGIKIGDLNLGGKTKEQALESLSQATKILNEQGLTFAYQDKKTSIFPTVDASDPDLSRIIFILENQKTIEKAFKLGRDSNHLQNFKNQLKFLFFNTQIKLDYNYNKEEIKDILKEQFHNFEQPSQNAKLVIKQNADIEIIPERTGHVFDYDKAIETAFKNVSELKFEPILLNFVPDEPKIRKTETAKAQEKAKKLAELCSINLKNENKIWTISQNQIRDWLEFQLAPSLTIGLNKDSLQKYLKTISEEINVEPKNAKFKVENGRIVEFQIHQGGKEVDIEETYNKINNYILNFDLTKIPTACPEKATQNETLELIIKNTNPQIPIGSINDFGIKELVGRGESNFAGSPANRRHNIKIGANKLNGILIAPNEEFSLNRALGEVSGATGYLPELVIKGDKTIPEYGGGLCQIGTTTFRVALSAGLPITERKPHSYRVVYYEPAGMDATIYSPKPDLKFINDTPAYLLLQTKIEGNNLIFELWGTSDGRKTELSKPKIYNIVSPGPTKIIETEDLAPGVKKCVERAHAGADAEFTRTITYPNSEVKTEIWKSHYVPWSAVCLVGKEPTPEILPTNETPPENGETSSETPPPDTSTSTNTNTDINTNIEN